ncbi:frataxin homolog, mitochondrial [Scaptodrosophila lebanonensis]|uniref:ferroxidase n=1 Tax=Drosophila lebanonensis TaxID=7225 RepID=A0A6J2UHU6_DROLE|nr:frataxin homolog, mitochondrial [Scaptodrosophila lebanonensis]
MNLTPRCFARLSNKLRYGQIANLCIRSSTLCQQIHANNVQPAAPVIPQPCRFYSSQTEVDASLDSVTYERVCTITLDSLTDYFEELTENDTSLTGSDVAYGDGVLTVNLGHTHGVYVINRQTPNKQIWLSSPTSGPKRFDFVGSRTGSEGKWIYKHTGESLHHLLQQEIPKILKAQAVDFMQLPYGS